MTIEKTNPYAPPESDIVNNPYLQSAISTCRKTWVTSLAGAGTSALSNLISLKKIEKIAPDLDKNALSAISFLQDSWPSLIAICAAYKWLEFYLKIHNKICEEETIHTKYRDLVTTEKHLDKYIASHLIPTIGIGAATYLDNNDLNSYIAAAIIAGVVSICISHNIAKNIQHNSDEIIEREHSKSQPSAQR